MKPTSEIGILDVSPISFLSISCKILSWSSGTVHSSPVHELQNSIILSPKSVSIGYKGQFRKWSVLTFSTVWVTTIGNLFSWLYVSGSLTIRTPRIGKQMRYFNGQIVCFQALITRVFKPAPRQSRPRKAKVFKGQTINLA